MRHLATPKLRKHFLLSFSFIAFFGIFSHWTIAQQMTFNMNGIEFVAGNGTIENGYINVQNQTQDTLSIEWRVIENTTSNDWFLQFCDFEECATNEFIPLPTSRAGSIPPGYNDQWYLGVDLGGQAWSHAVWEIEVEVFNSGIKDTLKWIVAEPNSIQEAAQEAATEISVFPNPGTGFFRLTSNHFGNEAVSYEILNLSGQTVKVGVVRSNEEAVNAEMLTPGVYFIRAANVSGSGYSVTKWIKK